MAAEIRENMKMDAKEQTKMIRSHLTDLHVKTRQLPA